MSKPVDVKVYFDGQIKRMSLDQAAPMTSLISQLEQSFPSLGLLLKRSKFTISYKDDEADEITINTEDELKYYLKHYKTWFPKDTVARLTFKKAAGGAKVNANTQVAPASTSMISKLAKDKKITLQSAASGKYLAILEDGTVVTVEKPSGAILSLAFVAPKQEDRSVVKLQSNDQKWLRISTEVGVDGKGQGGQKCAFILIEKKDKESGNIVYLLKSIAHKDHFIAVSKTGDVHSTKTPAADKAGCFLLSFVD
eukprot:TRINITY_DN190_c0_g1_i2.p1 TRINITY_DN190_c0_g1~~TRINITY_DN190_c0_g1_i2.p1  ORF type:complete len:271 (-),score=72.49 TRINITY_DN190_c0_g1_i2:104-862(-)